MGRFFFLEEKSVSPIPNLFFPFSCFFLKFWEERERKKKKERKKKRKERQIIIITIIIKRERERERKRERRRITIHICETFVSIRRKQQ